MTTENDTELWASNANSAAEFIREYGLAPVVYRASSIDFASEYGFEDDFDAADLWYRAVNIALQKNQAA
jgi:hypothetical protein